MLSLSRRHIAIPVSERRVVGVLVVAAAMGLVSCSDNVTRSDQGDAWGLEQNDEVEEVEAPSWHDDFCDDPPPAVPLDQANSEGGDWSIALTEQWETHVVESSNERELTALVASHRSLPVEAGLVVMPADDPEQSPTDFPVLDIMGRFGEVERVSTGGVFTTHEFFDAATVEAELTMPNRVELKQLRNDMVIRASRDAAADTDYPYPTGSERRETDVLLHMTTIRRELSADRVQEAYLFAFAPSTEWDADPDVRRTVGAFTDTTAFAAPSEEERVLECGIHSRNRRPAADFLFLVDTTSATDPDVVVSIVEMFGASARSLALDWRAGVTVMDPDRPEPIGGWRMSTGDLVADVVSAYDESPDYGAGTATLRSVAEELMDGGGPDDFDKFVEPIVIVLSAGPDTSFEGMSDEERESLVASTEQMIGGRGMVSAALGGEECDGVAAGSYVRLVESTRGVDGSLCRPELFVGDHSWSAGTPTTDNPLPHTPISSSIRVFNADGELARGGDDGFRFDPSANSVTIPWERFLPERQQPGEVAIVYQRWRGEAQ